MRFVLTRLFTVALLLVLGASCNQKAAKQKTERGEYKALRAQLLRISRTPTDQLDAELTRLDEIEITTERIDTCRDTCLEAYRAIAGAGAKSREAQTIIKEIEDLGDSDEDLKILETKQDTALELLEESESQLEKATELKDTCHDLLDDLEGEGLDRVR
jgi:hypothetical protein